MTDIYPIIVSGGRDYRDRDRVHEVLRELWVEHRPIRVAHGGQTGADSFAEKWCKLHGVTCVPYPAAWRYLGRQAGPARNARMLREESPSLVVAFPGDTGTADMIRQAEAAGVLVMRVDHGGVRGKIFTTDPLAEPRQCTQYPSGSHGHT